MCSFRSVFEGLTECWFGFGLAMALGVLILTATYLVHCESAVLKSDALNDRPILGILSQEQSAFLHSKFPDENYTSYIAASYVKDVEKSGARVVPILIGKDRSYYRNIVEKINGVVFPGGATYFNQSDGYADAGQHLYDIAKELNDAGDYFPIFGTCLGFELLIILASGRGQKENRITCRSYENLPLYFTKVFSYHPTSKDTPPSDLAFWRDAVQKLGLSTPSKLIQQHLRLHRHLPSDFRKSKLFRHAPEDIIDILKDKGVTVNVHQFCIVDDNLISYNLTKDWRVTSHSYDENGVQFVASIEHKRYPFYAVQFHPEKSSFEWKLSKNYAHSFDAVRANRYFMDFFVNECRKSQHAFASEAKENSYLIYNYEPKFTGVLGSAYHQCYMFEPRG